MQIEVATLQDPSRYRIIEELPHADLVKFIKKHSKGNNLVSVSYLIINLAFIAYALGKGYYDTHYQGISLFDEVFAGIGLGFFLTFFISFFIHESIHLLAYKLLGARQTTIKIDFKKLVFLAIADQFVLNRREFYFLAILPFAVITTFLVVSLFFTTGYWHFVLVGILILHTAGCSGDFALIAYFYKNSKQNILTYDDVARGTSYFYEEF